MAKKKKLKRVLNAYFRLLEEVQERFGYQEDWCVFPLVDLRYVYWFITDDESGELVYSKDEDICEQHEAWTEREEGGDRQYTAQIYTQRFLKKWVYRTDSHTMALVDTHTDGNRYLAVLDNKKERPWEDRPWKEN